jgi:hypothetical protein
MVGVELRPEAVDRRTMTLNGVLAVATEAVNAAAEVMLLPSLILAFFVAELTPSYTTIGLVPAIAVSFWTLGRLPATIITTFRRRKQPWVFGAALARAGAIGLLAVVTLRTNTADLAQSARPLLGTLFLCLIVFTLASGFGAVPNTAMLRSSLAGGAWDPFARRRTFWTALFSVASAVVVSRLLGSDAVPFPENYGRLFLAATVCLIAVAVLSAALSEIPRLVLGRGGPLAPSRGLRQPFLDAQYRRFLIFRVLLSATAAADPFLFLYAVTRLGVPAAAIGGYALAGVLGWVLSTPAWVWLERRSGARAVLQGAAVVRLLAPAIALALPPLAGAAIMHDRLVDPAKIFALAFAAIGASLAAQSRGNFDYLTRTAPVHLYDAYSGLTNMILAVVAFAPVAGGALIQRSGYEVLFGAVAVVGLVAVFVGGWLAEAGRPSPEWVSASTGARRALTAGSL